MASRADALAPPRSPAATGPSLGGAVRAGLTDLYFHSWRLVPANVVWSVVAIFVLFALVASPPAVVLLPLLAVPTAGLFRMSTRIARGASVSFWDAGAAWRDGVAGTLLVGGALVLAAVVLGFNVISGLLTGTPFGWALATLAFWGLVVGWLYAWTAWPILADPARAAWPLRDRLHLAGLLLLAHPIRLGVLGLILLLFLAASAVAIVALLMVSVAIATLVAARYVLPAADRLDERLAFAATRGLTEALSTAADDD